MKEQQVNGFKGFDKNFQCRGFQYEPGKSYVHNGDINVCKNGFHFCENPFDVFGYYPPSGSRFANVIGEEKVIKENDKSCSSKLTVGAEVSLNSFLGIGVKFILDKVNWTNNNQDKKTQSAATNTGYQSAATNTGYQSAATNTGEKSAATNTGNYSAATNTGNYSAATVEKEDSVAFVCGYQGKARGGLNSWIVLAERDINYKIKSIKSFKVNGKKIKVNTFYMLVNGKIKEVD